MINKDETSYIPNSINDNYPKQAKVSEGGFSSHRERISGDKIRKRSNSFLDHYSQPRLFYMSQSEPEKKHIIDAYTFELGKVKRVEIRERMLGLLNQIDTDLAKNVAIGLGLNVPGGVPENHQHSPDDKPEDYKSVTKQSKVEKSDALSMAHTNKDTIETRRIAIFVEPGVDAKDVLAIKKTLTEQKAMVKIISSKLGDINSDGATVDIDESTLTTASVLFDALVIPKGNDEMIKKLQEDKRYGEFLMDTYKHCKVISVSGVAVGYMKKTRADIYTNDKGVIIDKPIQEFVDAVKQHRFWDRKM